MRRFWIGVAGALALAGLMAGPGVAYAGTTGGASRASSCTDLVKKYQKSNKTTATIDFTNPKTVSKAFKQIAQTFQGLAKTGPSELKASFKHLGAAYDKLSRLDFSNPTSLAQLGTVSSTYAADFAKIAAYFGKQCKFTIPSAGTETIPSIPTS